MKISIHVKNQLDLNLPIGYDFRTHKDWDYSAHCPVCQYMKN